MRPVENNATLEQNKVMKRTTISSLIAAGLLLSGMGMISFAGNGPGNGRGYGGPPQSDAERAARQTERQERNGGICPNGGPRAECPSYGQRRQGKGAGKGQGQGWRRGARDGTGPRSANGTGLQYNQGATGK